MLPSLVGIVPGMPSYMKKSLFFLTVLTIGLYDYIDTFHAFSAIATVMPSCACLALQILPSAPAAFMAARSHTLSTPTCDFTKSEP